MEESPERQALETLTVLVAITVSSLNRLRLEEVSPQREKRITAIVNQLEVHNYDAMRFGLNRSAEYIARLKTGRGSRSKTRKPRDATAPKVEAPHQQLMAHHNNHVVGGIPDGGAQGKAIKWILERFAPEFAIAKYDQQLQDSQGRYRVSWLTVQKDIGRIQPNGRPIDATDRNAARLRDNLFIEDLRGEAETDYH
jgi:hypothetical protein